MAKGEQHMSFCSSSSTRGSVIYLEHESRARKPRRAYIAVHTASVHWSLERLLVAHPLTYHGRADSGITLCRVYLPRHHVLPVLLLGIGFGPWSHHDRGRRWLRLIYISDPLVGILACWSYGSADRPKGVLLASSRGSRRLRSRTDAVLRLALGLVCDGDYVLVEQHLHSGKIPRLRIRTIN